MYKMRVWKHTAEFVGMRLVVHQKSENSHVVMQSDSNALGGASVAHVKRDVHPSGA
jgi:hypothetical protein